MFGAAPFPAVQVGGFSFPHSSTLFQTQVCGLVLQQPTLNAEQNTNNMEKSVILSQKLPIIKSRMNRNMTEWCFDWAHIPLVRFISSADISCDKQLCCSVYRQNIRHINIQHSVLSFGPFEVYKGKHYMNHLMDHCFHKVKDCKGHADWQKDRPMYNLT